MKGGGRVGEEGCGADRPFRNDNSIEINTSLYSKWDRQHAFGRGCRLGGGWRCPSCRDTRLSQFLVMVQLRHPPVFPASAGMYRRRALRSGGRQSVPRKRGDVPFDMLIVTTVRAWQSSTGPSHLQLCSGSCLQQLGSVWQARQEHNPSYRYSAR